MNYLRSGRHRFIATVVLLVLLAITYNVLAEDVPMYDIIAKEEGIYLRLKGEAVGNVLCLPNGDPTNLPEGWDVYSCNDVNTPLEWHKCYINYEKNSFVCSKPD